MGPRRALVPVDLFADPDHEWVVRLVVGILTVLLACGVISQRMHRGAMVPVVGLTLLALGPLALAAVGLDVGWLAGIVAADVGVFFLLQHAVQFDLAPFILILTVCAIGTAIPPSIGGLCLVSAIAVPGALELFAHFTGSVTWAVGLAGSWAAACGVRVLLTLVEQLKQAQTGLSEKAASDERRRIAAELHDVIAHSLAVTMLHITGARLALSTDDREEAIEALAEAERSGRASLADVRRTVGLLADGAAPADALPDGAAVGPLVDGFRHAGLDVRLRVTGDLEGVDGAQGLAVYRVTQESLANVARHGDSAGAKVDIEVDDRAIRLCVSSPAAGARPANGQGHGITGMADRIGSLGGSFTAGPVDREWVVTASIPR